METQFQSEDLRIQDCLDARTRPGLVAILEECLIADVLQSSSLTQEFNLLVSQSRVEDLVRLSNQLKRVDSSLGGMQQKWVDYLYDQGFKMLNDEQLA